MQKIELIYFNAGGGHRAAARALSQVMADQPWQVTQVNLVEILDPTGTFFKVLGMQPEDLYNKMLARGLTLGMTQELKLLQAGIRLAHSALLKRLQAHWLATRPDLVVSLIPNFNRALCESLTQALPGTPFVTVITDMADSPPHFWVEPTQPQHLVCGTAHAVQQALAAGCPPQRVHPTSGMILSPRFYGQAPIDRAAERQKHGLAADQVVGLVMFGGQGSRVMKSIAARLGDVPLILICGKNAVLAKQLRDMPAQAARLVVEFTDDMAYWMQLADFFIGKPGPASLSEAVHMGLPVIVTRNAWTMPQERWNTEWVRSNGLGVVHRSFRTVRAAVQEIVSDLPTWQKNVRRIDNRAVFEVPQILADLLAYPTPTDKRGQPGGPTASAV